MVSKENFNKCSLVIKRIPEWINKDTRVEVRQITEKEVVGASMMGLSVFRDSIYERERKSIKTKLKPKKRLTKEKEIKRMVNDSSNYYSGSSSISSETHSSDSSLNNKPEHSRVTTKKKESNNSTFTSKSKIKKIYFSSSSSGSFEGFEANFSLKANLKNKKKISVNHRNLRLYKTLIPVVQKYETKEEMKARHEIELRKARRKYDQVVNKIKEEEDLMELQLSTYEKYKKRKFEIRNERIWPITSIDRTRQYLCPLHFCSVLFSLPEQHLNEFHKEEILTQEEKNIYLKALRKVTPNLTKSILNNLKNLNNK